MRHTEKRRLAFVSGSLANRVGGGGGINATQDSDQRLDFVNTAMNDDSSSGI
jgi:hypothetical protein